MNHVKNTFATAVAVAALSLVSACGELEAPASDVGGASEKGKVAVPRGPEKTNPHRLDFGDRDGEPSLTPRAKRSPRLDDSPARLDFRDSWRG